MLCHMLLKLKKKAMTVAKLVGLEGAIPAPQRKLRRSAGTLEYPQSGGLGTRRESHARLAHPPAFAAQWTRVSASGAHKGLRPSVQDPR